MVQRVLGSPVLPIKHLIGYKIGSVYLLNGPEGTGLKAMDVGGVGLALKNKGCKCESYIFLISVCYCLLE